MEKYPVMSRFQLAIVGILMIAVGLFGLMVMNSIIPGGLVGFIQSY